MFSFAVGGEHGDGLLIRSVSDQLTDGNSLGIINHLLVRDVECGMTGSVKMPAGGFCVRQLREDPGPPEGKVSPCEVELTS